jgi:hypothetical protein
VGYLVSLFFGWRCGNHVSLITVQTLNVSRWETIRGAQRALTQHPGTHRAEGNLPPCVPLGCLHLLWAPNRDVGGPGSRAARAFPHDLRASATLHQFE